MFRLARQVARGVQCISTVFGEATQLCKYRSLGLDKAQSVQINVKCECKQPRRLELEY